MRTADEPEFLQLMHMEFDHIRKRLRGMAMISRGIVPKVVLSRRAVDRMLTAANQFTADETGEAMVGFVVEDDTPEGLPTITCLTRYRPTRLPSAVHIPFSRAMPCRMKLSGGCKRIGISTANVIEEQTHCPII